MPAVVCALACVVLHVKEQVEHRLCQFVNMKPAIAGLSNDNESQLLYYSTAVLRT